MTLAFVLFIFETTRKVATGFSTDPAQPFPKPPGVVNDAGSREELPLILPNHLQSGEPSDTHFTSKNHLFGGALITA